MSDHPGWFQASDGRWYPPQASPGAEGEAVRVQCWNSNVRSWVDAWVRLGKGDLEFGFDGTGIATISVNYRQLTAVEYLDEAPGGWHTARIAYRSWNHADTELLVCLPNEQWGTLSAAFERNRVQPVATVPTPSWGSPRVASSELTVSPAPKRTYRRSREGSGATIAAVFLGAVLLVAGALLPWVTADTPFFTVSAKGVEGDGVFTLGGGLLVAATITLGRGRVGPAIVCVIVGLLAGIVAVVDMSNVSDALAEVNQDEALAVYATIGVGLWLTVIGAAVVVVASLAAMASDR